MDQGIDEKEVSAALRVAHSSQPEEPIGAKKESADWGEHVKTLLEIGGTGGVFIAVGYIAEIAHDELLGVNFPINRTVTDYALNGGRFFIETMAKLWLHPWISAFGIAVIALALFAGGTLTFRNDATRKRSQTLILCGLFALLAWKTYRLDVPYIQMEGVLKRPPLSEPPASQVATQNWLTFKRHDLWEKFVCGHILSADDKFSNVLRRQFPRCSTQLPQCGVLSLRGLRDLVQPSASHTCFSLEQEYVMDVFVTIVLVLATALVVRSVPASARGTRSLGG